MRKTEIDRPYITKKKKKIGICHMLKENNGLQSTSKKLSRWEIMTKMKKKNTPFIAKKKKMAYTKENQTLLTTTIKEKKKAKKQLWKKN